VALNTALGVEGEIPPECASWAGAIVAVARHQATPQQSSELLIHTETCARCADLLEDRRSLAYRWRLGGLAIPIFSSGRRLLGRAGEWVHSHVAVSAAVGVAGAGALTAALVIPAHAPPPHRVRVVAAPSTTTAPTEATTLPQTTTTTTTAPPAALPPLPTTTTTTTSAPVPAPVAVAPTTTTTAPLIYRLSAYGTPSVSQTTATITVTAHASVGGAPDPDTTVTATAPSCSTDSAPTNSSGTADLVLSCPLTALPATVTVTDTRGITTSFTVG